MIQAQERRRQAAKTAAVLRQQRAEFLVQTAAAVEIQKMARGWLRRMRAKIDPGPEAPADMGPAREELRILSQLVRNLPDTVSAPFYTFSTTIQPPHSLLKIS